MGDTEISSDEIEEAKRALETHKKKGDDSVPIGAITLAAISVISLFIYSATENSAFFISPLLPVIFGIAGLFKKTSKSGKYLSISAIIIGALVLAVMLM